MFKNKIQFIAITAVCFFCKSISLHAQAKIIGPDCIVPGTEYQYNFYGKWDKVTDLSICIEGGYFAGDKSTCYTSKDLNSIRVIWNDNIKTGQITISSTADKGAFTVKATQPLSGGVIDVTTKSQLSKASDLPGQIRCTAAAGGSCSPVYDYQWEQSDDNFHWVEIKEGTSQNLLYARSISSTVFVRRRVTDNSSGSVAYSDASIIAIEPSTAKN